MALALDGHMSLITLIWQQYFVFLPLDVSVSKFLDTFHKSSQEQLGSPLYQEEFHCQKGTLQERCKGAFEMAFFNGKPGFPLTSWCCMCCQNDAIRSSGSLNLPAVHLLPPHLQFSSPTAQSLQLSQPTEYSQEPTCDKII